MNKILAFLKENAYKILLVISIGIILFYSLLGLAQTNFMKNLAIGLQDKISTSEATKKETTSTSEKNNLTKDQTAIIENKNDIDYNIRPAVIKEGIQTVVVDIDTWSRGSNIILVKKGLQTKWTFRINNSEECNGNVLIEKFGLRIPVKEKESIVNFTPWESFNITCDNGLLSYFVKVVDDNDKLATIIEDVDKASQKLAKADTVQTQKVVAKVQQAQIKQQTPKPVQPTQPPQQTQQVQQKAEDVSNTVKNEPIPTPTQAPMQHGMMHHH